VQAAERIALLAAYRDEDLVFAKPDGTPIAPWLFSCTASFRKRPRRSGVGCPREFVGTGCAPGHRRSTHPHGRGIGAVRRRDDAGIRLGFAALSGVTGWMLSPA